MTDVVSGLLLFDVLCGDFYCMTENYMDVTWMLPLGVTDSNIVADDTAR